MQNFFNNLIPNNAGQNPGAGGAPSAGASGVSGGQSGVSGFFGGLMGAQKEEENFETSLKHIESFRDRNIIMTGATGGIGFEILKQVITECKSTNSFRRTGCCLSLKHGFIR